jgi:uncharacterized protein (TIGR04222 family)
VNPFDLRGPEFLLFYGALCLATTAALIGLRRRLEGGPLPTLHEVDPYEAAYLRGGPSEALHVVTLSLLDRGLIVRAGDVLHARQGAQSLARRPIELAVLQALASPNRLRALFLSPITRAAREAMARALRARRLLVGPREIAWRLLAGSAALAGLLWTGYTKLEIAAARGRHNTGLLMVLMCLVPVAIYLALRGRRTALGAAALDQMRSRFARLRQRSAEIRPGGATNEIALIAGVFGLAAVAGAGQADAEFLAKARTVGASGPGAGCGSGCSSGGGGGGCGGGGCGGGCGGCGG